MPKAPKQPAPLSTVCRVVVLISGNGSNLQAIAEAADEHYKVVLVVSNRADAYGLKRAEALNIPHTVIKHDDYNSRETFEQALITRIDAAKPDLITLAGFMRKLTPLFVNHYAGRLLNIHPSLLPKYRGLNTHQRALAAGDKEHGTSVHFVTEELDGGPIIAKKRVPVSPNDTIGQLAERVKNEEHQLYPMVVRWFASGLLKMQNGKALLHGEPIPQP